MPREIRVSYPVMAQAFGSPFSDEVGPVIDGCDREDCGAWGTGVCKMTVEVPDLVSEATPATYYSDTYVSAVGCIVCGELERPQYIGKIHTSNGGSVPTSSDRETDDDTLLFDAGNLALLEAIDAIRNRTQMVVSLNVGRIGARVNGTTK